jgi:hypothetical protein
MAYTYVTTENYVDDITQCAYVSLGDAKHSLHWEGRMEVVLRDRIPLDHWQLIELRLAEKQPQRREVVMGDGKHTDPRFIGNENRGTLYEDRRSSTMHCHNLQKQGRGDEGTLECI